MDDAHAIARVHLETWHTTYQGLLLDEALAGLAAGTRA